MKKNKIFAIILLVFLIAFIPLFIYGQVTIEPPIAATTFGELVDAIVDFLQMVAMIGAPILFIIAGFYFLTAAGNPEQIKLAKNIFTWTLVGLVIILIAGGFASLIKDIIS